jgi:carbonic anhydrase
MAVLPEVLAANDDYASSFDKGDLALPPARRFAILTCMDARLDPAKYAGLSEGDAHVIRNAGGRASDDAIRSLVISYKLLGTAEWFVIHHTDCGMEYFTDEVMRGLLANSLETAALGPDGFHRCRCGAGFRRGVLHRLAHHLRHPPERGRRCGPHPLPPPRARRHPDLRLRLTSAPASWSRSRRQRLRARWRHDRRRPETDAGSTSPSSSGAQIRVNR